MNKLKRKWAGILGKPFTHHPGLTPEALKKTLMGDIDAESKHCEIGGGHPLHWLEAGEGPVLVLIHGWSASGFFWKPLLPLLKRSFRVLAPDLPGHGLSSKDDDSYLPVLQAQRLLEWLTAIHVETFTVVGHSMGGEIATRMALEAPERIERMVLVDAIGLKKVKRELPWFGQLGLKPPLLKLSDLFFSELAMKRTIRLFMTGTGRPDYPEGARDIVLTNANTPHDLATYARTTRDGLFKDFVDHRLAKIRPPVLCLWGTEDKLVPPRIGKIFASSIPDARYTELPGTGHLLPWEEPECMAEKIIEFANDTPTAF